MLVRPDTLNRDNRARFLFVLEIRFSITITWFQSLPKEAPPLVKTGLSTRCTERGRSDHGKKTTKSVTLMPTDFDEEPTI